MRSVDHRSLVSEKHQIPCTPTSSSRFKANAMAPFPSTSSFLFDVQVTSRSRSSPLTGRRCTPVVTFSLVRLPPSTERPQVCPPYSQSGDCVFPVLCPHREQNRVISDPTTRKKKKRTTLKVYLFRVRRRKQERAANCERASTVGALERRSRCPACHEQARRQTAYSEKRGANRP